MTEIKENEVLKNLLNQSKNELVNEIFNSKVEKFADDNSCEFGKAIPYIGWFWRDVNFAEKEIPIGNCGEFIGVMENNKWDYPLRMMTEKEADKFIKLLENVMTAEGTSDDEIALNKQKWLKILWDWFQTLSIRSKITNNTLTKRIF